MSLNVIVSIQKLRYFSPGYSDEAVLCIELFHQDQGSLPQHNRSSNGYSEKHVAKCKIQEQKGERNYWAMILQKGGGRALALMAQDIKWEKNLKFRGLFY